MRLARRFSTVHGFEFEGVTKQKDSSFQWKTIVFVVLLFADVVVIIVVAVESSLIIELTVSVIGYSVVIYCVELTNN